MYTIKELAEKLNLTEDQVRELLSEIGEDPNKGSYPTAILAKLRTKFYKPIPTSGPKKDDDGPELDF